MPHARGRQATGTVGPNLDDAFASDKAQGFSEQTIRDVVRGQIAYPEEPMPANLYQGQDANDVASYVAKCAGVPQCGVTATKPAPAAGARRRVDHERRRGGARRQAGLRDGRLRRLPHAEGRGLDRQRRPEPRLS